MLQCACAREVYKHFTLDVLVHASTMRPPQSSRRQAHAVEGEPERGRTRSDMRRPAGNYTGWTQNGRRCVSRTCCDVVLQSRSLRSSGFAIPAIAEHSRSVRMDLSPYGLCARVGRQRAGFHRLVPTRAGNDEPALRNVACNCMADLMGCGLRGLDLTQTVPAV
ncbi:hypothetical protein PENSPDRAFT_484121 [Peniophora sp. CONT]|nr:hypothetical protein PENSPDRAFT_484121 [Peniophora sp. CONT]